LDPKWGKGWVRLGEALEASGAQVDEIKRIYEKAVELVEEGRMRNGKDAHLALLGER
jgi:predicted TPR repeat methyltransferase